MDWTTKTRYKKYSDWPADYLAQLKSDAKASPWRNRYHVEADCGLLNDPNGFSFFNSKWHLFYQHFPYGPVHGLKSWFHLQSDDLVNFTPADDDIMPDSELDSHGAYSGSAIQIDDKLFIFYTGNTRDSQWKRHPYQIGAWMDGSNKIEKLNKVLIDKASDTTDHFRDPYIFEHHDNLYSIIGAQNTDKHGIIKLYKANNKDVKNWQFIGNLDFDNSMSAYMIECPNLVFVDQSPVLIYCPQGLDKNVIAYKNIYPNTYKIADTFDAVKHKLYNTSKTNLLDYGFDCYASQALNAPDGKVYMISWLGLPDTNYPTDKYNYSGCLSIVKQLNVIDNKLYQKPINALTNLRSSCEDFKDKKSTNNCYEIKIKLLGDDISTIVLFADSKNNGLVLTYNPKENTFVIDRSTCGEPVSTKYNSHRKCKIESKNLIIHAFIDKSTFEIFLNDGQKVFSGRVFPNKNQTGIAILSGQAIGKYYTLEN